MERKIKIEYNPQRTYSEDFGPGHTVGRLTDAEVDAIIAATTVIYCSPTGIDTASGLTEGAAVRTLAKAIELAVTGSKNAVVLLPGFHTYFASHNTFGKTIIAKNGANLVCLGTDRGFVDSAFQAQNFVFDSQAFAIQQLNPALPGHDALGGYTSGTGFWFTGRADLPTTPGKANRFYLPMLTDGGTLRLCRLRLYKGIGSSELVQTPDPTEVEWTADLIGDLEVFFAGLGYGSVAFPPTDVYGKLVYNPYDSLRAMGDGLGRVFMVTNVRCDLAGGTSYRNLTVIWYNGAPQYFYETPLSPSEGDMGPLSFGNATTPGPMLRQWYLVGGGGYVRHTAIQPNKRIGDPGYEYSVSGPALSFPQVLNHAKLPAVYWNGVPMFSTYDGSGKCYSAKQMSDVLQAAAGVYASLPAYVKTILESAQRTQAFALGYQSVRFSVYNRFRATADLVGNINPDSPMMVSQEMTETDFPASSVDPDFFDSAAALCDNLFYGGALINARWYAEFPVVTKLMAPPYNYGSGDLVLPVHGLGVNCRLQNCEILGTDIGTQRRAYTLNEPTVFNSAYRTRADRIYVEAWLPDQTSVPATDGDGSTFSNFCTAQTINGLSISRKATGLARIKNTACVDVYQVASHVQLWHISAVACAYLATDAELVHGSCASFFTGYYLTPDASPMTITESVIREAVAQNLIPPGSTTTNVTSGDPQFKSSNNPYDLRLQALAKGDFFDSPALAYTSETSVFGGPREAGAYDDRGQLTIAWDSFEIDFPWLMLTESSRMILQNQRRDGAKPKLAVSENTVRLPLQWSVALSEDDLRNLERLIRATEAMVRIYFRPVAEPTKHLVGYVDQRMRHGGPYGLLSNTSGNVQLDIDCRQPGDSIYDYL